MSGGWIEAYSGAHVDVFNLDPRTLRLDDIACGLANCCRFAGQIPEHYSVAQHSVLMAHVVPEEFAAEALMHDASEAYMGDVPAPIKRGLRDYRELETYVQEQIAHAFGLRFPWPDPIHEADRRLCMTEAVAFGRNVAAWGWTESTYDTIQVIPWNPADAWSRFMATAQRLGLANQFTEAPDA